MGEGAPVGWSTDGTHLYVYADSNLDVRIGAFFDGQLVPDALPRNLRDRRFDAVSSRPSTRC